MKYNHPPATFGCQCDALTAKGERCKRTNQTLYPTVISNTQRGRPVRLCRQHAQIRDKLYRDGARMPVIHGGYLGGYNKYNYGNMVTMEAVIDWETIERLTIPKYWAQSEHAEPLVERVCNQLNLINPTTVGERTKK